MLYTWSNGSNSLTMFKRFLETETTRVLQMILEKHFHEPELQLHDALWNKSEKTHTFLTSERNNAESGKGLLSFFVNARPLLVHTFCGVIRPTQL